MEDVLDRKLIQGKVYYLVKWKNYPETEATWEYARRLPYIRPLIRKFNSKNKSQKEQLSSSRNVSSILIEEDSTNSQWGDRDNRHQAQLLVQSKNQSMIQKPQKQANCVTWRLPNEESDSSSGS